jgi:thioredoxin-related protein
MKKSLFISLIIASCALYAIPASAQTQPANAAPAANVSTAKIKWLDFEEAVALNKKKPKKMFIDMFTDWCGWCKKMDGATFINPVVVEYMNQNYYAVKFNAERKDTVVYNGKKFVNPNPTGARATHDLAQELLSGRMSYPSFIFLDENLDRITVVPGYRKAPEFETILHYIGENAYKTQKWEEFSASFKPTAVE